MSGTTCKRNRPTMAERQRYQRETMEVLVHNAEYETRVVVQLLYMGQMI